MEQSYTFGWYHVVTMFEGGTVEGYKVGEDAETITLRQVVFRTSDEPGQVEFEIDKEAIIEVKASRERPPQ